MKKCECRWSCNHHSSCYPQSVDNPDMEGLCQLMCDEDKFIRVTCRKCERVRVYTVCQPCWERIHRWLRSDSTFHCDACRSRNEVRKQWTIYEDVRS